MKKKNVSLYIKRAKIKKLLDDFLMQNKTLPNLRKFFFTKNLIR
jgi:hypothetical protein